ncbi:hypothetical protein WJX72_005584 [[Myrmecia] bisecta]|uniref:Cellulose synthase (UDP-forming) n=1 Tax=[Myrmecia] bisecta TaxID=41462 RepID=A0AAW1QQS4_9CHLO
MVLVPQSPHDGEAGASATIEHKAKHKKGKTQPQADGFAESGSQKEGKKPRLHSVHSQALDEAPEANVNVTTYQAPAFNDPEVEAQLKHASAPVPVTRPKKVYKPQRTIHWYGWFAMTFYLAALGFYLWVRITKTLDGLGAKYLWYGIYLLALEIVGSTTTIIYGINLLWNPVIEDFQEDPDSPGKPKVDMPYHVRVLIPCYKEELEIVRRTIMAAYDAVLPAGCSRTIYLCDDGKDPRKRKWVESIGPDVVYVSGRIRAVGEMNGKSGNMNNCCSQIYPKDVQIPPNEVICIFDADQVARKEFFLRTLPLFDGGDDVGMVLSPQCFHNLNLHTDIFNHSNIHFWEYMQPGYDALGFISCTGTNFLVRAQAFKEAGWSPTYTMTEDYALGMELKKKGWHCRYVQEYLAIGEAPDEIRNCYQQRSRWTKGHFQIMFNPKVCPLFQSKLSVFQRIMYCSGVWSYCIGALSTPTFILIPIITIWIGVFPLIITRWAAAGLTVYSVATYCVLYYVRTPRHFEALWFANVANQLLWWTYVKACWRAFTSKICLQSITFKATAKGPGRLKDSAIRDLWMPAVSFFLLAISIVMGVWQLLDGSEVFSPLLISVLWATYNAVPPYLLLHYAIFGNNISLQFMCRFTYIVSTLAGMAAIGLMWAINNSGETPTQFTGGAYKSDQIGAIGRLVHSATGTSG